MSEIVTDPEIPRPARQELEQAPLTSLIGFGDPVQRVPASRDDPGPAMPPALREVLLSAPYVFTASLAIGVLLGIISLSIAIPGAVYFIPALFVCAASSAAGTVIRFHHPAVRAETRAGPPQPLSAAVTYHRRYVVPEADLHDAGLARWRRASQAAESIRESQAVRVGLIDTVEIAAVLPYHQWDIAERLALLSAPERRLPMILQGVDTKGSDIEAVLGPQRRVHDLVVADIERRIARLEEFAALAVRADAALKRQRAIEELAGLNPDYEELLARLGQQGSALDVTGRSGQELRAVAAAADDAVRRANDAGRALVIPAAAAEPGS